MTYDIFEYVAVNNPYGAKQIMNKYGYDPVNVQTEVDMGDLLRQCVATVGEPALKDVLSLHPDRELLAEDIVAEMKPESTTGNTGGCGCGGCSKKVGKSVAQEYINNMQQNTGLSLQQGNLFLIGAALILAVAIVSK